MKTKTIFFALVLASSFASASQQIKSAQLICTNGIKDSLYNNVVATQQVVDGNITSSIDALSITALVGTPVDSVILGQFDKSNMTSFRGQEMPSTGFEKTLRISKRKVKENVKFGFQKIGQIIVGHIEYSNTAFESDDVSLLNCKQVLE